jgi:transcription termination factor NusB
MVDPVSSEGAKQAVEQAGAEGAGEKDKPEPGQSAGEASFEEVLEDKSAADAPEAVSEADRADQIESRDIEEIEDVDSTTASQEGGDSELREFVDGISDRKSDIDEMLERTMNGEDLDQQELLEMQMLVYSYSQKVELASKTVEKATGGLKQMMQVQV